MLLTMLLTEKDAEMKICPTIRPAGPCVASACMAWRWATGSDEVGGIKRRDPEDLRPLGFCGLAGPAER